MSELRGSEIQIAILRAVQRRNGDGTPLDTQQLMASLPHAPTRAALKSSVAVLKKHNLVEPGPSRVRDGQVRATYVLTAEGYQFLREVV